MSTDYADFLPELFDAWWKESFPLAPANKQTRENFIAFGLHVINEQGRFLDERDDAAA